MKRGKSCTNINCKNNPNTIGNTIIMCKECLTKEYNKQKAKHDRLTLICKNNSSPFNYAEVISSEKKLKKIAKLIFA